jgi:hypothetical protein
VGNPWLIGAGLLGVGLIGYWLVGGKHSPTQPPDSVPSLNSSVRGKCMQVTFGSNRVYPEITWTNNFTAVRQQSSGKGGAKGGGSGGFGSAKGGGSAGQGYLYSWDMMFNFGQMDQPSTARRGWIGGDQIRDEVMSIVTGGTSDISLLLLPFLQADPAKKIATLQFQGVFFAPGYVTGDANLTSWDHFESVTGYDAMFPTTLWIGFEQLQLGQAPTVPQLSIEAVPIDPGFSFGANGEFLSDMSAVTNQQPPMNFPFGRDSAGNCYNLIETTTGSATVNVHTGVAWQISYAAQSANIQTIIGFGSVSVSQATPLAIDGTEYVYIYSTLTSNNGGGYLIQCYHIETDGSLTFINIGNYTEGFAAFGGNMGTPKAVGVFSLDVEQEVIVVGHSINFVSTQPLHMVVFHDINTFLGAPSNVAAWDGPVGTRHTTSLPAIGNNPAFNGKVGIMGWGRKVVIYYGKYDMAGAAATPGSYPSYIVSIQPTYPDGALVEMDITHILGSITVTAASVNNYLIKDQVGGPLVPYADASSTIALDDYGAPQQYGDYVSVTRSFSSDHYKAGIKAAIFDGVDWRVIGSGSGNYGTTSDYSVAPEGPQEAHSQVFNHEIIVTARVGGGFGNIVNGTFGFASENTVDVTPPYIIYRILTSEYWGFATQALFGYSVTPDRVDLASYLAAVQYCEDQGIKVSVTYKDQGNLLSILNELVELYGGFLVDQDGIIYFGVVKGTYDTPPRVIDNSHFVVDGNKPPVNVVKAALEDGYNQVKYNYLDRAINYGANQVQAEDPVDMDINGPRSKTYNAKFVMAGSVAQLICNRALWSNLYGKDTYTFALGRKDSDLKIGDPIFLVDSFDPTLRAGLYARITDWQPKSRERADITAVREFPHIITASADFTQTTSMDGGFSSLVDSVAPMAMQKAYELPQEYQGAKAQLYFGYAQQSKVMGAQLYLSFDGTNYVLTQDTQPHIISGRLAAPLENRCRGFVEDYIDFYIFPRSDFTVATPTFFQNYDLDDVTQAIRAAGGGVMICGSEPMAIENLTLLGQNHYRARHVYRGWGGGVISSHNSGEYIHEHGAGIFVHEISANDVGRDVSFKIVPYNFAGKTYDVSSIVAQSYTILGNYWRPREMPFVRYWVDSAISWPNSTQFLKTFLGVTSGGCAVNLTWPLHDNEEGFGAGGYGAGTYGHFIMADSVAWRVDVMSKNGAAVSSFIVNTPFFRYTLAQNSADFNGFGKDVVYKTTAFTIKGDGSVVDIRSLSLNW